jgi:magnesium chelatase family protein
MLARLYSFATIGLHSELVTVEIDSGRGMSGLTIVGLGDTAVQESKERVRSAIRNSAMKFPGSRRTTINLAPADIRKVGPRYDLPMAVGMLLASGELDMAPDCFTDTIFIGELALDGSLRHVSGVLPIALAARKNGKKRIVVPLSNGPEAALVPGLSVIAPASLSELCAILRREVEPPVVSPPTSAPRGFHDDIIDFADIHGQESAKRALEIAAAGGHNVLMSGAPGAGKTLLAKALRGILPLLTREEALEVTQIYSVADLLPRGVPLIEKRPFRCVHHTASGVSIVGGGKMPGPGEISLAHHGVLFLDEIAEFPVQVLEVLRQPLEDRTITITRASGSVSFPANFILVAAMNPPEFCAGNAKNFRRKISAPLLDRFDLMIDVQPVDIEDIRRKRQQSLGETSSTIIRRVLAARERQQERFSDNPALQVNAQMDVRSVEKLCPLDASSEELLTQAVRRLNLSMRAYHRMIKVSRTIADLADAEAIRTEHMAEALQYRQNIVVEP